MQLSRSSSSRCLIQPAQCVSRPWLNLDNGPEATESIKAPAQKTAEEAATTQASEEATAESRADEELQARQTEREARRQAARASEETAAKQAASGMVHHQPMDFKFLVDQGSEVEYRKWIIEVPVTPPMLSEPRSGTGGVPGGHYGGAEA